MNNKRDEMRTARTFSGAVAYHDNGQLKEKSYYKNGKEEGTWVSYWSNGQLWWKGDYVNGEREGTWVSYWDDGQLLYKGNYRKGEREGAWVSYWCNGQLSEKGKYENGQREGTWVSYNEDGSKNTDWSGVYRNGEKVSKVSIEIKTYEDLRQYLNTLSTEQLNDDVTVYIRENDDYYPSTNVTVVRDSFDVLHKGHPYLIV